MLNLVNRPGQEPRCPAILPCAYRRRRPASPPLLIPVRKPVMSAVSGRAWRPGWRPAPACGCGNRRAWTARACWSSLGEGVIGEAAATAPHGRKLDRVLTAKNTMLSVIAGCLFAGQGYDQVLRTVFAMPGLDPVAPGTPVPGPALSKGRMRSGEHIARRTFELDAARTDAGPGIGQLWHGMEVTAFDGTTAELDSNGELAAAFGTPTGGKHRCSASSPWSAPPRTGGPPPPSAATTTGRTPSLTSWNPAGPGHGQSRRPQVLLHQPVPAVLRHRCAAVLESQERREVRPLRTLESLPDGSELVMLRESDGMRARRRRDTGDRTAARLPDTLARLVEFAIVTRTRGGRAKTSTIRLLTTLLDHEAYPAREIAMLYAERWQIEIAFLHLKKTLRGARRVLRGKSVILARQEAWAFLLVHNMIAAVAARAAALAGIDPDLIPFTAVLGLVRAGSAPIPAAGTAAGFRPPWPARRRRHRPSHAPSRAETHLRQDSSRTTLQAHRRSDLHHYHHAVKSPTMAANTLKLRAVSRTHAEQYLRGLLAPLERKNGWTIAEHTGEKEPKALQRFLNLTPWDAESSGTLS